MDSLRFVVVHRTRVVQWKGRDVFFHVALETRATLNLLVVVASVVDSLLLLLLQHHSYTWESDPWCCSSSLVVRQLFFVLFLLHINVDIMFDTML